MVSKDDSNTLIEEMKRQHNLSNESVSLLLDKNLGLKEFEQLCETLDIPDQSFMEWRESKSWIEKKLQELDSMEITSGRYYKYLKGFNDISSEQALIRGRMIFAVEYDIALAELVSSCSAYRDFISRPFTEQEKAILRSVYKNFRTKDALVISMIEKKTNHDIVAANTWAIVRAQQLGLDTNLMRGITHFSRTSEDPNSNATGNLLMKALGRWTYALSDLLSLLDERATNYSRITCIAETHGQDAQLTTLGYVYANLGEQISDHLKPLIGDDILLLDGKIGGAIGTDADMRVALPNLDPQTMYKKLVEEIFGLKYKRLGYDQAGTFSTLATMLDTITNVGFVLEKAAIDTWIYASRGIIGKTTTKGESGSSAMPQKTNPFLAEGAESLLTILSSEMNPIKRALIAYREQGDLRRSITLREIFHPIMLSIIAIGRLKDEISNYKPNIVEIEGEIYNSGPKVISSLISNYLRTKGVPDAYDRIKAVVMKAHVYPEEVSSCLDEMLVDGKINKEARERIQTMLNSVIDVEGYMGRLEKATDQREREMLIEAIKGYNMNNERRGLLGDAVTYASEIIPRIRETRQRLAKYSNQFPVS